MERRTNNDPRLAKAFSRALKAAPVLPLAVGGGVAAYELVQPSTVNAQEINGPGCVESNSTNPEYWEICRKIIDAYDDIAKVQFVAAGLVVAGVVGSIGVLTADTIIRSRRRRRW